ncbi:MAG TPA: MFS transporter [Xanthobacteraceae bacterium]|nr:MFS transporter [Xanthobacteraceae bacterium]
MKSRPLQTPTRTIVFLAAASFASAASVRICDPILPEIAHSYDTSIGNASAVITTFGGMYAAAQLLFGFVGDRYGKLETIAVTTLLSVVSAMLCAFAPTLPLLIAARLFAGFTAASIIPLSMAWIGDEVPYERRQPVIARFLFGQILGLTLGQAISGFAAEHIGWRSIFYVLAGCFLVSGLALARELLHREEFYEPKPAGMGESFRQLGRMLRKGWVWVVFATVFLEGAAIFGGNAFIGSYLRLQFNVSYDVIGLIVSGFGIGGLVFVLFAPAIVRRLHEEGLVLFGGIFLAVSFFGMTVLPGPFAAVPLTVLSGLGFYMLHNTLQTNATQMAPESRSLAVSCFATCLFLGQAAGVSAAAPAFDYAGAIPLFIGSGLILLVLGVAFRFALRRKSWTSG